VAKDTRLWSEKEEAMPYKDKQKRREYKKRWNKQYYAKNRQQELARTRKRAQELCAWLSEYKKSLCCESCREDHPACLEFHHIDKEQKEFEISNAVNVRRCSREKILLEIGKCTILCANCHRKLHSQ